MPRKAYGGVSDVARNGIKIYGGVNNIARKIIKGYAGVGGVAQQFWPPGENVLYKIFKDGTFFHVPNGMDIVNNVIQVIWSSTPSSDLNTNKTIWWHELEYTRPWSIRGVNIDSNFIYNSDTPARNYLLFPVWEGDNFGDNTKRIKIPAYTTNYYIKVTGYGYFSIMLFQVNSASNYSSISLDNPTDLYFDSDSVETKIAKLRRETSTKYIDRIGIMVNPRTVTYNDEWLENLNIKKWNSSASTWSVKILNFSFGYNKFETYYNNGTYNKVIAENVSSIDQVYSMTWRDRNSSSVAGGELLSIGPFSVKRTIYDWNGNIVDEITTSAEQIVYNGKPFYRYRYNDSYHGSYNISSWYPQTLGDNVTNTLFSEDGRYEYEFFESLHIDYDSVQIQEISIITQ